MYIHYISKRFYRVAVARYTYTAYIQIKIFDRMTYPEVVGHCFKTDASVIGPI